MVATGVSGCGDGVLQTTEVASSPRDAGYPEPRNMSFDERMGRAGGISNLVQIFWGKADITTDFVESGRASGDALVSGIVYVRTASGAGAPVGDTDAQVTSFEREDLARFQGENGAEPSVPRSFDLRRLRLVRICNTQFSVFEARADDDRFDLALSYLRARC